jgi:alanine racemase
MLYGPGKGKVPRQGVTRLEIDLDTIASNYHRIALAVAPSRVMAVVKDNAYGHGLIPVAMRLKQEGCRDFGVATLPEALALRDAGLRAGGILILRTLTATEIEPALIAGFRVTTGDPNELLRIDRLATAFGLQATVHLKVDTGLGRLGFLPDQTPQVIAATRKLQATKVEGVYSHFAVSAKRHESNDLQLQRFLEVTSALKESLPGVTQHIAATAALVGMQESWLDMVRPGGLLFGLTGLGEVPWGCAPALTFKAPIVQVKTVPPGWNIGYRLVYSAPDWLTIGVIAAGAGDSYPYSLKLKADVLVCGKRCRVLGMALDQCMIDLSPVPEAECGDEAVLVGESGGSTMSVEELARVAGTSFGEILSRVPGRIPRLYLENGHVSLIESLTDMSTTLTRDA